MLKHSVVENLLHVSIDNRDFSYRIPIAKMGKTIRWTIGAKGTEGISMKNVSIWTLKLFTNKTTEREYIEKFQELIQQHAPKNSIDWKMTLLAVEVQNEYNRIQNTQKIAESEIIAKLEEKYNLG